MFPHIPSGFLGRAKITDPREEPLPPEAPYERVFTVGGMDLGQASDASAITILERRFSPPNFIGPPCPFVFLRKIRRYEHADYTLQADDVLSYPRLDALIVEYNGVGRPVIDLLRRRAREVGFCGPIIPLVTVASSARIHERSEGGKYVVSVPKIDLVSSLTILQQSGRFKALLYDEETERNWASLMKEMRDFQMRVSRANVTFGNIEKAGAHDDLVMSGAIAAWWMLNKARSEPAVWMPPKGPA